MACLSEFTCAVYADGELPESEARDAARHLASCGTCRRSVEALQAESRMLVQCFQDTDFIEFELEDPALARQGKVSPARFAMAVLALAALLHPVLDALTQFELPDSLAWLSPFRISTVMNFSFTAASYVFLQGVTVVSELIRAAALIALEHTGRLRPFDPAAKIRADERRPQRHRFADRVLLVKLCDRRAARRSASDRAERRNHR